MALIRLDHVVNRIGFLSCNGLTLNAFNTVVGNASCELTLEESLYT